MRYARRPPWHPGATIQVGEREGTLETVASGKVSAFIPLVEGENVLDSLSRLRTNLTRQPTP